MKTVEQMLARITRRGSWEITPIDSWGADYGLRFHWVTRGQWGNPFARSVHIEGTDLAAIVAEAFEKTEPRRDDLEGSVRWAMWQRRDEARRSAARMVTT